MGIDIWEVIDAASTKPYGFQPFYPGPELGGHCIPLDPYYKDTEPVQKVPERLQGFGARRGRRAVKEEFNWAHEEKKLLVLYEELSKE